jgi:predicted nucleic acid-binding protein
MDLIADTNIFLAAALNESEKTNIVRLTEGANIAAPEILPYEIGNALSAMCKRGRITPQQAVNVYQITQQIPVRLLAVDIGKALDIALKFNIYAYDAYDAYFLECARALARPLITLDRRMQQIARELGIEILE